MTARNPGVTRLPSGKWRWRIMIDGRQHTGTEDTAALAALARAECHIAVRAGKCPKCGHPTTAG